MLKKAWDNTSPKISDKSITPRDGSNIIIIMTPIAILVTWSTHSLAHLFGFELPENVTGAIGGLVGYFIARRFRY